MQPQQDLTGNLDPVQVSTNEVIADNLSTQQSVTTSGLNLTEILYTYSNNLNVFVDINEIDGKITLAIAKIEQSQSTQTASPESHLLATKLSDLKRVLEKIKTHNQSFDQKKESYYINRNLPFFIVGESLSPFRNDVKEIFNIYKEYFLIKFSADGNPDNCDESIKDIFSNFDEGGPLFDSIKYTYSRRFNIFDAATFMLELKNYLARLVILSEYTISNDSTIDQTKQENAINEIKKTLLVFPGDSKNDHECIQGMRQRIMDATLSNKRLPIELNFFKDYVDSFVGKHAHEVHPEVEIHLSACLLGSLVANQQIIKNIDSSYFSPTTYLDLHRALSFGHNLYSVLENLTKYRQDTIDSYKKLIEDAEVKKTDSGKDLESSEREIHFDKINLFIESTNFAGFNISTDNLIKEDATIETEAVKISQLISPSELTEKYLQLPTIKYQKLREKEEAIPEYDYLKYLPKPEDLLETSESILSESSKTEILKSRVDAKKIVNLVDLIQGKTNQDGIALEDSAVSQENIKKSIMVAGLITLRNILDGYKIGNNPYIYYLKFNSKFKEITSSSFEDYFFEMKEENLKIKDEFIEMEPILYKIKYSEDKLKKPFYKNLTPSQKSEDFLTKLSSIEDLRTKEDINKFKELLGESENFLQLLYLSDRDAFIKEVESNPELISQIFKKNVNDVSCAEILAKNNDEFLVYLLEEFKKKNITEGDLTPQQYFAQKIIDDKLLISVVKNEDNIDIFRKIIGMFADDQETKLKILNHEYDDAEFGCKRTLISYANSYYRNYKIVLDMIPVEKINLKFLLGTACYNGDLKIVEALLKKEEIDKTFSIPENDPDPIIQACENTHLDVLKLLLSKNKFNINAKDDSSGISPLVHSCIFNRYESAKILLEQEKIDVNAEYSRSKFDIRANKRITYIESPLLICCRLGKHKIIEELLKKDEINVNYRESNNKKTPLHFICTELPENNSYDKIFKFQTENFKTVNLLLINGADIDAKDSDNKTPILYALQKENINISMVKALLESGAETTDVEKLSLPTNISQLLFKYQDVNTKLNAIFSQSNPASFLAEIDSFTKDNLMVAKSFKIDQDNSIELNALGLVKLYKFYESKEVSSDGSIAVNPEIKNAIEKLSSILPPKAKKTIETYSITFKEESSSVERPETPANQLALPRVDDKAKAKAQL